MDPRFYPTIVVLAVVAVLFLVIGFNWGRYTGFREYANKIARERAENIWMSLFAKEGK